MTATRVENKRQLGPPRNPPPLPPAAEANRYVYRTDPPTKFGVTRVKKWSREVLLSPLLDPPLRCRGYVPFPQFLSFFFSPPSIIPAASSTCLFVYLFICLFVFFIYLFVHLWT